MGKKFCATFIWNTTRINLCSRDTNGTIKCLSHWCAGGLHYVSMFKKKREQSRRAKQSCLQRSMKGSEWAHPGLKQWYISKAMCQKYISHTCRVAQTIKKTHDVHCTRHRSKGTRRGERNSSAEWSLKLVWEEITQSLRHRVSAGPEGETVHLCLCVGLQSEKAAHLSAFSVDDSSSHKIRRVRIHSVQQSHTEA